MLATAPTGLDRGGSSGNAFRNTARTRLLTRKSTVGGTGYTPPRAIPLVILLTVLAILSFATGDYRAGTGDGADGGAGAGPALRAGNAG